MVHLVAARFLVRVDPGWGDQFRAAVIGEPDLPFTVVDLVVVESAEHHPSFHVCLTQVADPPVAMVNFRPVPGPVTAVPHTSPVPGFDGPAHSHRVGAALPSDVQNFAVAAEDDRDDPGVAEVAAGLPGGHRES